MRSKLPARPKDAMSSPSPRGKLVTETQWKPLSQLFPPLEPSPELEALPKVLSLVWPLNGKHRKSLPHDIAALSEILTCQRSRLATPYWQRPNYVSAYLYYFLPWNLIRLMRLLHGITLPAPEDGMWLLDAGAGPLTVSLALWLAKPQWRDIRLNTLSLDSARQPLQLGVKLFRMLAAETGATPWQTASVVSPLEDLPRHFPRNERPWLISAANALNEMREQTGRHGASRTSEEWREGRLGALLEAWRPLWTRAPLLVVEPGTRLGGDTVAGLRAIALEYGLSPLAPCTHAGECPLLEDRKRWCHFVFSAQDAPDWLKALSREARLFKTSLSLAPLLLGSGDGGWHGGQLPVRVLSQSFDVDGGKARYGCASCGLCLMPDAARALSGSLCMARDTGRRDGHSGARIVTPAPVAARAGETAPGWKKKK